MVASWPWSINLENSPLASVRSSSSDVRYSGPEPSKFSVIFSTRELCPVREFRTLSVFLLFCFFFFRDSFSEILFWGLFVCCFNFSGFWRPLEVSAISSYSSSKTISFPELSYFSSPGAMSTAISSRISVLVSSESERPRFGAI